MAGFHESWFQRSGVRNSSPFALMASTLSLWRSRLVEVMRNTGPAAPSVGFDSSSLR
ncbi:hypothetical protein LILAB_18365 [Corallococcus macrosporus]|uniref:Uncharacterized protein n=1 Tax=Myxococcus fulvus (strain ATCC BAA-855 / HW-1) TaxID=483219 RepID=F8C6I6_MYXFH|nr:hypothetical protein LILAB_18365 [Corallococcus macrosporus]